MTERTPELVAFPVLAAAAWMAVAAAPLASSSSVALQTDHYEVIDANAGVVLASTGPVRDGESDLHAGFFESGTRRGFRRKEGADGLTFMQRGDLAAVAGVTRSG